MPFFTTLAPFCAMVFRPCGQYYPRDQKTITWLLARQQTTPELSGTFWTLPPEPTPTRAGTLRNPPEPSEPCLWNLQQHAPELSGTLRNFPRPSGINLSGPSETYLRNLWNPRKSSGTFREFASWNLHHFTPELSGTFCNLPPEPTPFYSGILRNPPPEPPPAHAGTLRNLLEPSSGTGSCDPHRQTPELIWAEDPISLHCWGIKREPKHRRCFWKNRTGSRLTFPLIDHHWYSVELQQKQNSLQKSTIISPEMGAPSFYYTYKAARFSFSCETAEALIGTRCRFRPLPCSQPRPASCSWRNEPLGASQRPGKVYATQQSI